MIGLIALLLLLGSLNAVEYDKNPYRAMLYSAALPGGGQIYNQAYVKAAVVAGLQAYLIGTALHHNERKDHYQELMNNSVIGEQDYLIFKQQRDGYRDDLRSDYWWMGTVLVLSVADAFVDAHLYNFNQEKDKIKIRFEDKMLQVSYHF
ncbi:MAG: DUF5683 domain-containing protein [Candidatus Cloacimonadaceae bacterium]